MSTARRKSGKKKKRKEKGKAPEGYYWCVDHWKPERQQTKDKEK